MGPGGPGVIGDSVLQCKLCEKTLCSKCGASGFCKGQEERWKYQLTPHRKANELLKAGKISPMECKIYLRSFTPVIERLYDADNYCPPDLRKTTCATQNMKARIEWYAKMQQLDVDKLLQTGGAGALALANLLMAQQVEK